MNRLLHRFAKTVSILTIVLGFLGGRVLAQAPKISSFYPTKASTGTKVTIVGTGLTGATAISFGGVVAEGYSVVTDKVIEAYVPKGAISGKVTVKSSGGKDSLAGFVYIVSIYSFTPLIAATGATVTIKGTKFTGATAVTFGGTNAAGYSVVNDSTITAIVGTGSNGSVSVTANNDTTFAAGFICVAQPTITSFSASPHTIGRAITIYGTGLSTATDVKIGGASVLNITYNHFLDSIDKRDVKYLLTDTVLTVYLGNNNTSGDISVTNPLGTATISGFTVDVQANNIWTGGLSNDFALADNWSNGVLPSTNATITIPVTYISPEIYNETTINNKVILDGFIGISAQVTFKDSIKGNGYIDHGSVIIDGNIGSLTFCNLDNLTIKSGTVSLNVVRKIVNYFYTGGQISNFNINGGVCTIADNLQSGIYITNVFSSTGGTLNTNTNLYDFMLFNDHSYGFHPVVSYPINGTINGKIAIEYSLHYNSVSNTFKDVGVAVSGATVADLNSNQVYSYSSGWSSQLGSTTALSAGQGYRVLVQANGGFIASGRLVTGNVTPALNKTASGFSFVANPYQAVLDFTALPKTNLQAGYWYLDPTAIYKDSLGDEYEGYDYFGVNTGASNTYSGGLTLDKYIQPGQGFFVQNTASGNSSLTFTESSIASTQTPTNVFGTAALNRIATGLFANGKNIDGAVAVFNSVFANGLDKNDATKFSNRGENLTFSVAGKDLCANGWSMPTATDELPMHLYNLKASTAYTLKLDASQFVGNGLEAYLQDKVTNTKTLLVGANNEVSFTTGTDAAAFANSYSIVFGASALPVKNISLTASALHNSQVSVKWSTIGESNIASYKIERSTNGTSYTVLATVSPSTSHSYSYIDATPSGAGVEAYYRIKVIDNTGAVSYSNIAKLTTNNTPLTTIKVYPNPVTGSNFKLELGTSGKYNVEIVNQLGQKVYSTVVNHTTGNLETVVMAKQLAAGNYHLTAVGEDGKTNTTTLTIK